MVLSARTRIVFLVAFAITIPCLHAGIAQYDDYLKKEAAKAQEASLEAYDPHPENITDEFNAQVRRTTLAQLDDQGNSTRRNLGRKKYKGPCKATNPIDICWRCKGNWSKDRKRLAKCVMGFGHKTTGGIKGRYYVVTDPSDNNVVNPRPGTLRHAVQRREPLWIIFARSMSIRLKKELLVSSDKTIDGRGANVQIAHGAGITVQFAKNVIIHNLRIHNTIRTKGGLIRDSSSHVGIRTTADGDGISIFGSSNIWIDHVSMSNCADGLIDVIQGSTGVTISNCHFTKHNDVMLFGASDKNSLDKIMQITVAFNHFGKGLIQRMPRCRWGFVHVVNNDYTHWLMYAIGGSSAPTIISQGNRFIAPPNRAAREITHRHYAPPSVWKKWQWRSQKDLLMNGAKFIQSGRPLKKNAFSNNKQMITPQDGRAVTWLTRFSGQLKCIPGKPC